MHISIEQPTRFWVILPAAGIGKRLESATPKQYLKLHGKPVIMHALSTFLTHPLIHKVIIVVAAHDSHWSAIEATLPAEKINKVIGSAERHLSVYQGLLALKSEASSQDWVLVHDAVRPCLQHTELNALITALQHHPVGGLLGVRVRDTLKRVNSENDVVDTLARENVWQAQTPQMFRYGLLCQALEAAIERGQHLTDEASAIELAGYQPRMVVGSDRNIKITYPEDLAKAEIFLTYSMA